MKDRRDLMPAVNEIGLREIIAKARGSVTQVLIDQERTAQPNVAKIFKEAQTVFRNKCDKIDQEYTI